MAMEMAVDSMEMALGAISHPGRVPEQRLLSPKFPIWWRQRCGTFCGDLICVRVYVLRRRIYRRQGKVGGALRGPHHGLAPPLGHATPHGVAAS